jgi:hypothetical protein
MINGAEPLSEGTPPCPEPEPCPPVDLQAEAGAGRAGQGVADELERRLEHQLLLSIGEASAGLVLAGLVPCPGSAVGVLEVK